MTPYLNSILENWRRILAHFYMGVCIFYFVDSPLGIVCMAPIIGYAYSAWSVDLDQEGFCLAVFVGDEFTEEFVNDLAEDCHEQTGRDVKVVIVKRDKMEEMMGGDEIEVEIEPDGDE